MANGHTYTPKATRDYENRVLDAFVMSENDLDYNGAFEAYITIKVPMPKGWSQRKKNEHMRSYPIDIRTPDLDNVAKSILDALNGLAYKDDKQVVSLSVSRVWGSEELVEVYLNNI
jgi:Holliday junction resolvase RusA-like endonuclease